MLVLASSLGWYIFAFGVVVFGLWGFTAYDILKSRPGWGYTVGIFFLPFPLLPFIAMVLWWVVGKWADGGDPKRAAIAKNYKSRLPAK